jgi:hypothetical protein
MFESLRVAPAVEAVVIIPPQIPAWSAEAALEALLGADQSDESDESDESNESELLVRDLFLPKEILELKSTLETIDQLRAFKGAVEQFGLSRALVAFADYNKALSAAIPEIPAIESLDADIAAAESAVIVAALEAKISDMWQVFIRTWKARVKNLFARFSKKSQALHSALVRMKVLNDMIAEGRVFDEEKAKKKKVKALSFDHLVFGLENVHKVVEVLTKVFSTKLPISAEAYDKWLAEFRAEINSVKSITGTEFNEVGRMIEHPDVLPYEKKTMAELGYDNIDKFHKIYALLPPVVTSDKTISELEDRIIDLHWDSSDDEILKYAHRATYHLFDASWMLGYFVYWIGESEACDMLKKLFYCTDKQKKGEPAKEGLEPVAVEPVVEPSVEAVVEPVVEPVAEPVAEPAVA